MSLFISKEAAIKHNLVEARRETARLLGLALAAVLVTLFCIGILIVSIVAVKSVVPCAVFGGLSFLFGVLSVMYLKNGLIVFMYHRELLAEKYATK